MLSQGRENHFPKVLMIARAFPPFLPVGHSIRVIKFIKYLPALGWYPVVLTVDDKYEYETLRKVGSETLLSEISQHVKIIRSPSGEPSVNYLEKEEKFGQHNWLTKGIVKIFGGARRWTLRNICLPDRYLCWLPFAVKKGIEIIKTEGIDIIFSTCPPHSSILVGAVLKLLTSKPLILDYRDDWIDTPWHRSKPAIVRTIERGMERWAVNKAHRVILVTEWSREAFIHRYLHQSADKFVFIPNGCDLDEVKALSPTTISPDNSVFKLVHAGSLNVSKTWGRNLEGLFKAIHNLLEQEPSMAENLNLIFAGDLPKEYQRLAEEMGVSHVVKWLGYIPHTESLQLIKLADMLLAVNYDGWATIIPGKIYEYWAVGGPPILLLSCPGAASNFLKQHNLGFAIEPSDVNGIQKAILRVYLKSKSPSPLRINNSGIEEYDRQALARRLSNVFSTIA